MNSDELIKAVSERMAQFGVTQTELATACDISQPHLSKVLSKRVKLAQKTQDKLSAWLDLGGPARDRAANGMIWALALRLESLRPRRRMQIMELLYAIERLIDE